MSQYEKLLQRIINNPKTVRFEELDKILISQGFACDSQEKGRAIIFIKEERFVSRSRIISHMF